MHIAFSINKIDFLRSHRLPVVREARCRNWRVTVLAAPDEDERDELSAGILRDIGCQVCRVRVTRSGTGALDLARTVSDLSAHYRALEPDLVHHVTPKMVSLGTVAARRARVPAVVNAISGLGIAVSGTGAKGRLLSYAARAFYAFSLRHPNQHFIVQNERDRAVLEQILRPPLRFSHFFGSGVDLSRFVERPLPEGPSVVVLAARLLRAKGLLVFAEAARRLKQSGVAARFVVCGPLDPGNPDGLSERELAALTADGVVEYWGVRSDMHEVYAQAAVACLPTYYGEGLPLTLAEAAAAGRAIVTTDLPGCRDTIVDGVSGFLVPPKDIDALVDRLRQLLQDRSLAKQFGAAGRKLAERRFSVESVVAGHFDIYEQMVSSPERS